MTATIVVLAWPPDRGHGISLGAKVVHRLIDPSNHLPALPPPLPPGVGDDGEAVVAHDELESEYYRLYNSSTWTRWRMEVKAAGDPRITFARVEGRDAQNHALDVTSRRRAWLVTWAWA